MLPSAMLAMASQRPRTPPDRVCLSPTTPTGIAAMLPTGKSARIADATAAGDSGRFGGGGGPFPWNGSRSGDSEEGCHDSGGATTFG